MKRAKLPSILFLATLLAAGTAHAEEPRVSRPPSPPGAPDGLAVPGGPAFPAAGPTEVPVGKTRYNIDFTDVDIRKVVETVSDITGRNFLVDDRVQGRVMVIGPRALTADEVYQVFLSILHVKGFAVVPAGKVEKIVPSANVVNYGVDIRVSRTGEETGDRYLTQIIPLQYAEAEDLRALLAPILPKTDSITSYSPTNLLIVTTTETLLARMAQKGYRTGWFAQTGDRQRSYYERVGYRVIRTQVGMSREL